MEPIQRANVPQAIAERIIELITTGELRQGDQLPPQRELAKQLGVGVSSVRESLQSLTALGVVTMQPGKGTFVSESFDGLAGRHAAVAPLAAAQETRELLEARLHLDAAVAEMACRRAAPEDLAALRRAYERMSAATARGDMAALEEADLAFHLQIAEAAHNGVMTHIIRTVVGLITNQIHQTPFTSDTLAQHREILEAIEAADVARAREAVRRVIGHSLTQLALDEPAA